MLLGLPEPFPTNRRPEQASRQVARQLCYILKKYVNFGICNRLIFFFWRNWQIFCLSYRESYVSKGCISGIVLQTNGDEFLALRLPSAERALCSLLNSLFSSFSREPLYCKKLIQGETCCKGFACCKACCALSAQCNKFLVEHGADILELAS